MVVRGERYVGVVPKSPIAEFVVRTAVRVCVPEIIVCGEDNLAKARKLIEAGKIVVIAGNHQSHLDGPVMDDALWREGYGDMAGKLTFFLGKRIFDDPLLGKFASAVRHIQVWPKTEKPMTEADRIRKTRMTRGTVVGVREAKNNGDILVVFPEGTRTRSGNLQSAVGEVAHYLRDEDVYVLPVGVRDTDKAMPVQKWPRPPILRRPEDQVPVTLNFGNPISSAFLFEGTGNMPSNERNAVAMGRVMKQIEGLL